MHYRLQLGFQPLATLVFLLCALALLAAPAGADPAFISLHSFSPLTSGDNGDGAQPERGSLVEGGDGNFYGVANSGGASGDGAVFKVTPSGTLTTLYSFTGGSDGADPFGGLALGTDGNFYGTTPSNGAYGSGTVFKLATDGTASGTTLTTLYSFGVNATDGETPLAALVLGTDGNFYGTAYFGGVNGSGTVFKLATDGTASGTTLTTLYKFGTNPNDGANPSARLAAGSNGDFYGTTESGGANGDGTVFQVTLGGVLTTLYSFTGGSDGGNPYAGLVLGTDGSFYGMTLGGGANGSGTVFKLATDGTASGTTLTTLYSFGTNPNDAAYPETALVIGPDGNFYGTTYGGGTSGDGTVFKVTPSGVETTLISLTGGAGAHPGAHPIASLVIGTDGNFYGTTYGGGANGNGTVFEIAAQSQTLYNFTALDGSGHNSDGSGAQAALVLGADGNFYGVANNGGANGHGTVFQLTPSGAETTLYSFGTNPNDGSTPSGVLVEDSGGDFYGTTQGGGASGSGTVFKLVTDGTASGTTLTTLYSFGTNPNDGANPFAGLAAGSNGDFYGTTPGGGASGSGTVFQVTLGGVLTTLYSFTGGSDGGNPYSGLVLGQDGNFYGTAQYDGVNGFGTVFKFATDGTAVGTTLTTLYSFGTNPNDAAYPGAALIQGRDGNFYGVGGGGSFNQGAVFKVVTDGTAAHTTATTLYSFTGGNDGGGPSSPLVQGADGSFYGTTVNNGAGGDGTVFKVTLAGMLTTLLTFNGPNGRNAFPGLASGTDGNFYGITSNGGTNDTGVIFRVFGPPQGHGNSQSTPENTPVTFTIAFNDPVGLGIDSIAFPTQPTHGTVAIVPGSITETGNSGTASVTYTPANGYSGADGFTYAATNYTGTSAAQSVTVSVTPPATPTMVTLTPGAQTATTAAFSATATSRDGNALSYSWSVSPAVSGFASTGSTPSGTSFANTLTVSSAGTYTVAITVMDDLAQTATATQVVTFSQVPTTVTVSPSMASVAANGTQTFTASVMDQFGATFTPTTLTWSVSGGGTINASTGVFTAGTTSGTYTVTATATANSATQTGTAQETVVGLPTITGISPTSGTAGTVVTITGTNFTNVSAVTVNGVTVTFTVVNSTTITFTVPAGLNGGVVAVTTASGTVNSGGVSFTVLTWTAKAIGASANGTGTILWDRSDGAAGLWITGANGTKTAVGPTYGPYAGWTATSVATAPDGTSCVLWTNTDGRAGIWIFDKTGTKTAIGAAYGPYSDGQGAWSAQSVGIASDDTARILWTNTNGRAGLWSLSATGIETAIGSVYGPYAGWTARSVGVAGDDTSRILWTNTDGRAGLWSLSATGVETAIGSVYGPYAGWTAQSVGVAGDGTSRVLWTNADGRAGLWSLSATGVETAIGSVYGPYAGWTATAVATAADGTSRVLWNNVNRMAGEWLFGASAAKSVIGVAYGPY